jgi:hypothetical protein
MSYRVNGKNLAVGRLMVRGKDADRRLKYLHCGPQGMTAVTPNVVARVSLPEQEKGLPLGTLLYPQEAIDALKRPAPESKEIVQLPAGEPAVTGPHFLVPQIDKMFPSPQEQTFSMTVNGDLLRKLLTVACEVCNDSEKTMRLRFCKETNSLRIDTYRQPGEQEFVGVIKGMKYEGHYIPGEPETNAPIVEQKPVQGNLMLKPSTGRRFRGENE